MIGVLDLACVDYIGLVAMGHGWIIAPQPDG